MTSIHTNTTAMVALRTVESVRNSLETTQSRISTGRRVVDAADSAAYWAISTTTKMDESALREAQRLLSVPASLLDVTYVGLEKVRQEVNRIREIVLSAVHSGVSHLQLQAELSARQAAIRQSMESAQFNGINLLVGDPTAPDYNATLSFPTSLSRSSDGLELQTIDFDREAVRLFDLTYNSASGILDTFQPYPSFGFAYPVAYYITVGDINEHPVSQIYLEESIQLIDETIQDLIDAQLTVGVTLDRIQRAQTFAASLADAHARAAGALSDANMEEESARLRAAEVQMQLALESLGIANASPASIMALLRDAGP